MNGKNQKVNELVQKKYEKLYQSHVFINAAKKNKSITHTELTIIMYISINEGPKYTGKLLIMKASYKYWILISVRSYCIY